MPSNNSLTSYNRVKGSRGTQYKMSQAVTNRSISSGETACDGALQTSSFLMSSQYEGNLKINTETSKPSAQDRNPFHFRIRLDLHTPFRLPGLSHKPSQHTMHCQDVPLQSMRSNDLPSPPTAMMSGSLPPIPTSQWETHGSEMLDLPDVLPLALSKDRSSSFDDIELPGTGSSSRG